jgi:broad specificity phosphatase PhoE
MAVKRTLLTVLVGVPLVLALAWALAFLQAGMASRGAETRALPEAAGREARDEAARCDRGDVTSCNNLGALYEAGEGLPAADPARAAALYRRACDDGALLACVNLARTMLEAEGGVREPERVRAILDVACERGELLACLQAGRELDQGGRLATDLPAAARRLQQACDANIAEGCVRWADMLVRGAVEDPHAPSPVALYQRACERGSTDGCTRWAPSLLARRDDPAAVAQGRALLERACVQDDPEACRGAAVELRRWVPEVRANPTAAEVLRGRACQLGVEAMCAVPRTALLLRHAEAGRNTPQAAALTPEARERLTEAGEAQARALAEPICGPPEARLLASPTGRALQTAALAVAGCTDAAHEGAVQEEPALRPADAGEGEDAWSWEARAARLRAGEDARPPGGESLRDAGTRALSALDSALSEHLRVAGITHGDVVLGVLLALDVVGPADVLALDAAPGGGLALEWIAGAWVVVGRIP